jgi:hypothetical protein
MKVAACFSLVIASVAAFSQVRIIWMYANGFNPHSASGRIKMDSHVDIEIGELCCGNFDGSFFTKLNVL